MQKNSLKILDKAYEATRYAYIALNYFPKSEKFTLAADIRNGFYKVIELIIIANKKHSKLHELFQLDVHLFGLQYKVRLAKDLGFIPFKKYEILSGKLTEIGKMLGGWIKSIRGSCC